VPYKSIMDMDGTGITTETINVFRKNTSLQEARSLTYDLAYGKSRSASTMASARPRVKPQGVPAAKSQGKRDAVRRYVEKAAAYAGELRHADDPVSRANAGFDLLDSLEVLWDLREQREPDWGDLLNIVQTVLHAADLESLADSQCLAIHDVVRDILGGVPVEVEDLDRAVHVLESAGFDP